MFSIHLNSAHKSAPGTYLVWTDQFGTAQVRFYREGPQGFALLLAQVGDLKLHGQKYTLHSIAA